MDRVDEPVDRDDPVRVRSDIDAPSRWLWLVKWCVLAQRPHYPYLIVLYLLYPLVTISLPVSQSCSPDGIRAHLRLQCRGAALVVATHELPIPDEQHRQVPAFHARVSARTTRAISRWITRKSLTNWAVLLKWWLLGMPQILLCWAMEPFLQMLCSHRRGVRCCAPERSTGVCTTFCMGIVRWRYRVAVYVSLMRDEYPPFRLDLGGS